MKAILLLTDFSNSANNAIHFAMRFFESETCRFYIMHVHKAGSFISDDLMVSPTESIYESFTKVPKKKLDELVKSLKENYQNPKHQIQTIVDFDVFTDAVNQAIRKNDIDFVVMGSNGATGAKEIIFGSNTVNVIRNVICNTIVVPDTYTFNPISKFLFPLQYDDSLEQKHLNIINEFSKTLNFKLHVLRITKENSITTNAANDKEQLKDIDCKYTIEDNISFYQAVTNYLKTNQINMAGLIVHDKSLIKRFFTESPTIELSKVIKLPLLLFHDEKN